MARLDRAVWPGTDGRRILSVASLNYSFRNAIVPDQMARSSRAMTCRARVSGFDGWYYPAGIAGRAGARWLEEYADTRMGDLFIWKTFNEACIKPAIWNAPRDKPAIEQAVADDLPAVMDYLEQCAPLEGFKFGARSIADISIAVFFRNLLWSRVTPGAHHWPRTTAWVERVVESPALRRLTTAADELSRTPPETVRDGMSAQAFTVAAETVGGTAPRRGPMSV